MIGFLGKGQAVLESINAGGEILQGNRYFALPCTHYVQGFGMIAEPDCLNQGAPDEFTDFNSNSFTMFAQGTFVKARAFDNPLWYVPMIGAFVTNHMTRANIQGLFSTVIRSIRFRYNTGVLSPASRNFNGRISDPGEVIMLSFHTEGHPDTLYLNSDTQWAGNLHGQLLQFQNCKALGIVKQAITAIEGWPANLEILYLRNLSQLAFIAPLPKTLKHITWSSADNLDASFYNAALQSCSELEDLYFTADSIYPNAMNPGTRGITGILDLTGKQKLKVITMKDSPAMSWVLPSHVSGMEVFDVRNANLHSSNIPELEAILVNGKTRAFWIDLNDNLSWNKNFVDQDFADTLLWFGAIRSGLSGTISLIVPKPSLIQFAVGNLLPSSANSNVISEVDLSGLMNVNILDLSGCDIEQLTLPVTNSMHTLYLFGNKISVSANLSLMTQLRSCIGLVDLRLGSGSNPDAGQNSADGFGNDLNIETLVNLTAFFADACVLSGMISLPQASTLTALSVQSNPLVVGFLNLEYHATTLYSINVDRCSSIQLPELNTLQKIASFYARFSGLQTFDISGRSDTVSAIGQLLLNDCPNLSSIILPVASGAAKCALDFHAFNNPALISITNMENFEYTSDQAAYRRWHVSNCPQLDIAFPFGANSFLPGSIYINNNAMSQANVEATIDSIYQNRGKN